MPQLILECSSNIIEKHNFAKLFKQCHEILANELPTDLSSCKSRVIIHENYYIGNGNVENAFVSLHLKVMAGRSMETLNKVEQSIINVLKSHFAESLRQCNLQITLEFQELLLSKYFKIASNQ